MTAAGKLLFIGALLLTFALIPQLNGQEDNPSPAPVGGRGGGRGGRGGRGGGGGAASTREFLGLGTAPDTVAAKKGEPLYKQNCATCHGENARGSQGPNLVRSVTVLHDEKGEEIGAVVRNGRPGMPPFPNLSQDDIYNISQFLHLQIELAANRGTYGQTYGDLRNKVTGDPRQGEAFFQANCTGCHSATGDLAKIGSKFQQAQQLQSRFLWPAPAGPPKATVTTASGEKITGTVLKNDDFNFSLRDAAGEYHSWPKDQIKIEIPDPMAGHRALLAKYSNADIHNMTAYLVTLK
jgi:cytochrome c oxidase cbb3-type subunit III